MKKSLFFCARMLIVLAVFSFIGCPQPIGQRTLIPPGKGVVRIDTGTGAALTAMPAAAFDHYEYWFSKNGAAALKLNPSEGIFELEPGTWTVTVKAFAGTGTDTLAAEGTSEAFAISAGEDAGTISVTIHPVVSEGYGTLSYTLTYPSGITVESFTLTLLAGDSPIDLLSGSPEAGTDPKTRSGTKADIPAGYYEARAVLKKGTVTGGKSEVVHIYKNMSTPLEWVFTEDNWVTLRSLLDGLGASGGTLTLEADYTLDPYTIGAGKTITLQGDSVERTVTLTGNGRLFTVQSGGKLILGNKITLKGHDENTNSLVYVTGSSSALTMNGGSKITGNINSSSHSGGGVFVISGGTFTMAGGEISGNTSSSSYSGGGVFVISGGTFTMAGGEISGNTSNTGKSLYKYSDGTVVYGGTERRPLIAGNQSANLYTDDDLYGAVYDDTSPLRTMLDNLGPSGGTLTLNGDYTLAPYIIGAGKTITLQGDGTEQTITLTGSGNLFRVESGGKLILGNNITLNGHNANNQPLVYVTGNNSALTMNAGSKITGNTASSYGGGVNVDRYGIFTMAGGEISGNTSSNGGGVYNYGTFTMAEGKISGNTSSSYGDGGGVFAFGGTFTMAGGEISGNTATGRGGGVYVYVNGGTFIMNGGEISGNTAPTGKALYKSDSGTAIYGGTEQRPLIAGDQSTTLYTDDDLYGAIFNTPGTVGTLGLTINAWVNDDGSLITSAGNTTISRGAGNSLTVQAATGLTGIQWSLNGGNIPAPEGTAQAITLNAVDYQARTYNLGLRVSKGGVPYSAEIAVTVTN
ncbi:hypothetical protein AGMMS49928_24170 [Spirochaetia bacterium]|nr:hypothetical protein AGMMS49928_24170 [Spirochaetia bacterium]